MITTNEYQIKVIEAEIRQNQEIMEEFQGTDVEKYYRKQNKYLMKEIRKLKRADNRFWRLIEWRAKYYDSFVYQACKAIVVALIVFAVLIFVSMILQEI